MMDMSALRDWRFSIDAQGIAWAVFDREGESQNSLGRRPLEELGMIVERAEQAAREKAIRGLVFMSGKEKGFIVGADVREFEQIQTEQQVVDSVTQVNAYLNRIGYEGPTSPTVATLHGIYRAHLYNVPFENLDIVPLGRPLSLEPAALHDKIVRRHRGGCGPDCA